MKQARTLIREMQARRWSFRDIAARLGTTERSVWNWAHGVQRPRRATEEAIVALHAAIVPPRKKKAKKEETR